MTLPTLDSTIQQYAEALKRLEQSTKTVQDSPIAPEQPSPSSTIAPIILEVLTQRDRVQKTLEVNLSNDSTPDGTTLYTLSQLDKRLRAQAKTIAPYTQSADWRASFNPDPKAWWWFLEVPQQDWSDRFDWLWSAVAVTGLTVSVGLLGDIAPRFLTGSPDSFGAFAVSIQSMLTLLAAGGALTKAGQEGLRHILESLKIRPKYWHELGAISAIILAVSFYSFRQSLPWIATQFYTNSAKEIRKKGDWGTAEAQLQRAIKLNADDTEAHFQLGNLYEDLQQIDKALPHYQQATSDNHPGAINNLARLYILKKSYSASVSLLLKALDNDKHQPLELHTKHTILKNLGWARLKQKNYPDALVKLEDAIDLEAKAKFQPYEIADSHCLLAQVKEAEAKGNQKVALNEWNICNQNANITIPEQDEWITIAQERLIPKEPSK
jgi:tetratricopeptide (TPR) repeat protein